MLQSMFLAQVCERTIDPSPMFFVLLETDIAFWSNFSPFPEPKAIALICFFSSRTKAILLGDENF